MTTPITMQVKQSTPNNTNSIPSAAIIPPYHELPNSINYIVN